MVVAQQKICCALNIIGVARMEVKTPEKIIKPVPDVHTHIGFFIIHL
jgi:hypothetical protein